MDAHLLKSADLPEFAARPEAVALLSMALAEVHSNIDLFGGQDSGSFKIKAKLNPPFLPGPPASGWRPRGVLLPIDVSLYCQIP